MNISFGASDTQSFDVASCFEWLETNGLGGWASSTISGAHTRRYHGLLVAATTPPTGRMVLLSKLDETIITAYDRAGLGCNLFPGAVHPMGHRYIRSFERDLFPVWQYEAAGVSLRKTIAAVHGENTTLVVYDVLAAPCGARMELRPFIAGRDYHRLVEVNGAIRREANESDGLLRLDPYAGVPAVYALVPGASFSPQGDWYLRFEYEQERLRGLEHHEDLFSHGVFTVALVAGGRIGVIISTTDPRGRDAIALLDAEARRRADLLHLAHAHDPAARALTLAADQFIVRRGDGHSIVAGYHWFTDWGRDAMIAMPGLCLATGRMAEAQSVLRTFARAVSQGMVPNRFPDGGGGPIYDGVDTSLWFFVAVWRYVKHGGDTAFVRDELLPVMRDMLQWHDRGTRHRIRIDEDGLLSAGEPGLQLTWMDAKVGEWVVTPRRGKPVEINALWYSALRILGKLETTLGEAASGASLRRRAKQFRERFIDEFWDDSRGCLFDVVDEDRCDASIRPNQIFALSLPFPVLEGERAERVLQVVEWVLVTPRGLRSLAPGEPGYRASYTGDPASRDGAYHQGTVWSWLLGPYVSALVRVRGEEGRAQARRVVDAFLPHIAEAGVGTVSEVFDAEPPHAPHGCIAQAWSVAELLRVLRDELGHSRRAVARRTPANDGAAFDLPAPLRDE